MAKYMFYQDPGHGWVKVFVRELKQLGIDDKISMYSYRRKDIAYLEEDCDLSTLISALRAKGYTDIKFNESHTNKQSKIRGYDTFRI